MSRGELDNDLKKILSLEERTCALPSSSVNRELRGGDSEEKLQNWSNIINTVGENREATFFSQGHWNEKIDYLSVRIEIII